MSEVAEQVRNLCEIIRNETGKNANTAVRVGDTLSKIVELVEGLDGELSSAYASMQQLQQQINAVGSRVSSTEYLQGDVKLDVKAIITDEKDVSTEVIWGRNLK
jgi:archaellum component FlaC